MATFGPNPIPPQVGCIGIGFPAYSVGASQYGMVGRSGSNAANQPVGTTPVQITGFNDVLPNRVLAVDGQMAPEGVTIPPAGQSIVIITPGLYYVYADVPADLSVGRFYALSIFVNGASVGLTSIVDLSNQSSSFAFNVSGLRALDTGDEITIMVRSDLAAQTFILNVSAEFGVFRVR